MTNKMENSLRILQLETALGEATQLLHETSIQLIEAKQDRELLARALCRTAEFTDWLLDQDVSSAHMRKPSGMKGVEVEGADDVTLALAFAGRPNAG